MINFNFKDLVAVILSYLLSNVLLGLFIEVAHCSPQNPNFELWGSLFIVASVLFTLAYRIQNSHKGSILKTLGIHKKFILKSILIATISYLIFTIITIILSTYIFPFFHLSIADQHQIYKKSSLVFNVDCYLAILIAPMIEEILFRGFLQNLLSNKLGNILGILVTALLFTSAHVQYYGSASKIGRAHV